jgi:hypothetical protein
MNRLFVELGRGEVLRVGEAFIQLERKSGQRARLRIVAEENVRIVLPGAQERSIDKEPENGKHVV